MNVVYASSGGYAEIAGISMRSLFESNRDVEELAVWMVDCGIGGENRRKLLSVAAEYGRALFFVHGVDPSERAGIPVAEGRWHPATFQRLFLGSLLPPEAERVLYLDCDTLVRRPLAPLWERPFGSSSALGVDDCRSGRYAAELGLPPDAPYVGSGVLLLDLARWRREGTEERFLAFLRARGGDVTYVDQGVLNGTLGALGQTGALPPRFGAPTVLFDFPYRDLLRLRRPAHPPTEAEWRAAVEDPAVVHFTACFYSGSRPWNADCLHPFAAEYLAHKAASPWREEPPRPDGRGTVGRLTTAAAHLLPRGLMLAVMSFLHARAYPWARGVKSRMRRRRRG